ncbi:MAG: lamin tail domain-containing protein [Xenococcus sp. MO_188.B8]|nr:lamin tail domain-containing protein [Xenococcus sp. MO_188.B8]
MKIPTWITALLLVVYCTVAIMPSALAADRRSDTTQLTIMTYNAEFLWDGIDPEEGSRVDFPWKSDETAADAHMKEIADVIKNNNPDIINLVEVENIAALTKFNDNFLSGEGYKPYLVKGRDNATGQDVALLTRIDPETETIQRDDRKGQSNGVIKSVSKNYFAKFDINGNKLALVGLHFLAIPPSNSRKDQRQAQADAIRQVALDLRSDNYLPIVLGDFNDYDGDILDKNNDRPITNVLAQLKNLGTNDPDDDLINTIKFIRKRDRYTSYFDPNRDGEIQPDRELTAIDFILLPNELEDLVQAVTIDQSYDPREVSDHFPVMISLNLSGTPKPDTGNTLKISSLLPNPNGDETQLESATIKNIGEEEVDLTGWRLRDRAGKFWNLDSLGSLRPNESELILRRGQSMALNNNGDTVELLNPGGQVVDTVTYSRTSPDITVLF